MSESIPIFALEGISFAYPGGRALFENLNFALHEREHIGLYAPNGSGKTTLLRLIVGLERPSAGRLLFRGAPVLGDKDRHALRCKIGMVLQYAEDQLFCPTVLEDVAFGPLNLGLDKKEALAAAKGALRLLGLEGFEARLTHKLSGGEKKLVSLATVLSMRPEALLLDEPIAGLDQKSEARLVEILKELPTARVTVSHDRVFLKETSSRILTIADGVLKNITL